MQTSKLLVQLDLPLLADLALTLMLTIPALLLPYFLALTTIVISDLVIFLPLLFIVLHILADTQG